MQVHLNVEIGRIVENSPYAISLSLHVDLLNFTRLHRLIRDSNGCRLISKCSGERSSRSLEGRAS